MEKTKKQNLFFAIFLVLALVTINILHCTKNHECTSISLRNLTNVAYCDAEELAADTSTTKVPIIKAPSPLPGGGKLTEEQILELLRRTN